MSKTYDRVECGYYCEWNPRVSNVLQRMARKGDTNRILRLNFIGSGAISPETITNKKFKYFRRAVQRMRESYWVNDGFIDFHKHNLGEPISISSLLKGFNELAKKYPEVAKRMIVEQLIYVDNHNEKDWSNFRKTRWMALMHRNAIKIKGQVRKAIPDLYESNTYRPLILAKVGPFHLHHNKKNLCKIMIQPRKKDRIQDAEFINFERFKPYFKHLWVDSGDLQAFLVNPHSREAEPVDEIKSARWNGQQEFFQPEEE